MKYSEEHLSCSTWMLHTSKPQELVGGVAGWTSATGPGVVQINVFKDSKALMIEHQELSFSIRLQAQLGLQLAGLLLRVVAQNRELRLRAGHAVLGLVADIQMSDRNRFICTEEDGDSLGLAELSKVDGYAELEDAQDQWNLLLAESVCESLALSIFDRLGQLSASRFWAVKRS